jgi:ABC-type phosphate/phosphonate transport system substrate-binding protein
LPFAAQIHVVLQSSPVPVAILALVDSRLPTARAQSLKAALLKMGHDSADADTLAQLHLQGFVQPQLPGATAPP